MNHKPSCLIYLGCCCKPNNAAIDSIIGSRFSRIIVESYSHSKNGKKYYNCKCDCGHNWKVSKSNLKTGAVSSCGCLRSENTIRANTSHGMSRTRTYSIWAGILARCKDSKNKHYGGKKIIYDPRWSDFKLFLSDMGIPSKNQEIDRINNNLGYFKSNCRWVDSYIQVMNKSRSVKSSTGFYGVTKKRNLYEANITHKGKKFYLGSSKNPIDCAKMYNKAAIKYHKEFAILNKI